MITLGAKDAGPKRRQQFASDGLKIWNPAGTYEYKIVAGAIAADRQLNLPVITATDTIAVLGLAQTFGGVKTHSADVILQDGVDLALGTGSDALLRLSAANAHASSSNEDVVLALSNNNQAFHVTDKAAVATDWNLADVTHPTVYIHSNTTPATDYVYLGGHDGTTAHIGVGGGTLTMDSTWADLGSVTTVDINGGTADSLTSLSVRSTGAAYDLKFATATVFTAGKTLTIDPGDSDRTVTLSGNPTLADWFDQAVKAASNPTFGNLTITSFAANWTNAGRTVADLGSVTTVDINGGTVDGISSLTVDADLAFTGAQAITTSAGDLTLTPTADLILNNGLNFIGDTANTNMTVGLTINQGGNDDGILAFKSSDVGHPYTAVWEADSYGHFTKISAAEGGLSIAGLRATSETGLRLQGVGATVDTTKTTSTNPIIVFEAYMTDGSTSVQSPSANAALFGISSAGGAVQWLVDEEGDTWQTGQIHTDATTTSTSVSSGSGVFDGGVGIAENLWAGGTLNVAGVATLQTNLDVEGYAAFGNGSALSAFSTVIIDRDFTAIGGETHQLYVTGTTTRTTATGDVIHVKLDPSGTVINSANVHGTIATLSISEPVITLTDGSVTNAYTVLIAGAPTEASNNYALAIASGVFETGDSTNATSGTTGSIHTAGGIGIEEDLYCAKAINTPDGMGGDGEQLTSGGNNVAMDWAAAGSLREFKNILGYLNPQTALDAILAVSTKLFTYRRETEDGGHAITTGDYETEYAGVMADEAPWVMHQHGRIFSPVSAFGYTVAAFQAMQAEINDLKAQLAAA